MTIPDDPLIGLLRRAGERMHDMSVEQADELYAIVCECHIAALRKANERLRAEVLEVLRENTRLYERIADLEAAAVTQFRMDANFVPENLNREHKDA
jgi:DNA-binding GntR family transcriptional regulator